MQKARTKGRSANAAVARTNKTRAALPFFALRVRDAPQELLDYAHSAPVQSARFSEADGKYAYALRGTTVMCGGLISELKRRFYPLYVEKRKRRNSKTTKVRGSSAKQGKCVDEQLLRYVHDDGKLPARASKMTRALIEYWEDRGHALQAAQLPVPLPQWGRMTQADCITRDPDGHLWLWEVKTGAPVGGFRTQKTQERFKGVKSARCTPINMWQLQMHYTAEGLISQGVPIRERRVIQVHMEKGRDAPLVKVHPPAPWLQELPPLK